MPSPATRHRLEHWVHWSLLTGLTISGLFLMAGLVIALTSHQERPLGPPPPLGTLFQGAMHGNGVDLLDLGLLALVCTPILRVAVLALGWGTAGDYRFAVVALVVLGLLVLSLCLGVG